MTPTVSTAWLAENLGASDLCLMDASFYMPAEKIDPHAVFLGGHIPGARFFDIETIADVETALPHMVPSVGRFEHLIRELGISNSSRVVFYDQKGIFSAPRGWWMMRLFGHDRVAVLDGGLPKWRAEGRAIETGVSAEGAPGDFRADFRSMRLRGIGDMLENLESKRELVLDARAAGRFAGTAPEPRPGLPSGHMPGAKSVPASELLGPGQVFLPADVLRARFAVAGVGADTAVVTSCGTGVSAAILSLGLELAGLKPARCMTGLGRSGRGGAIREGDVLSDGKKLGLATRLSHAGRAGTKVHGFVNLPVHRGSTVLYENMAQRRSFLRSRFDQALSYGLNGSATHHALEDVIAEIEGGTRCQITSTGLSAVTTALLGFLSAGDHVLMPDSVYGPVRTFCDGMLKRLGITTTYYRRRPTPRRWLRCFWRAPRCCIWRVRGVIVSRCRMCPRSRRWGVRVGRRCSWIIRGGYMRSSRLCMVWMCRSRL